VFYLKKVLSLLVMVSLVFAIVACNDKEASKNNNEPAEKEEVTITYSNWNVGTEEDENNIERQMIAAFEEKYPHINVEIKEITGDWLDALGAAAGSSTMPDVYMISEVPVAVANDWALDVNELVADDEEYAKIADAVKESVTYNGKTRALPVAQFFFGYYVNKDLYNEANLDYPEFGVPMDGFTEALKSVTNIKNGVVGTNYPWSLPPWYPSAVNPDMGYHTFKDGTYQMNSKEFIEGVNYTNSLVKNGYTFETLTEEQKANFKGEDSDKAWQQGEIALRWDATWSLDYINQTSDFDWDFIGVPGGRTYVVNDFMSISKSTKHPEEAYTFLKWMGFGKEGFLKRLELAEAAGQVVASLPLINDEELLDAYFEQLDAPGVRLAYENINNNPIIEPYKMAPGFNASTWDAPTGVAIGDNANATVGQLIEAAIKGEIKYEDYANQLNELANSEYEKANEAINK
jgi:multiple sugar transport system substrate-binding protein